MAARTGRTEYRTLGTLALQPAGVPARSFRERQLEEAQREKERRERRRAEQQRAERARELSIGFPFLLTLAAAVFISLFICYNYLTLNSAVDQHMDRVKSMEKQLENLRAENDALEQSIDTSVDLNYVYRVAVGELGMVHAGHDNVITYDKTESEYVRQYESIN